MRIGFLVKEILETIKIVMVAFFIFGLDIEKGKRKYWLLLYWPFILLLGKIFVIKEVNIDFFWLMLIFILLFQGNFKKNFQQFLFAFLFISFPDMITWSVVVYITGVNSASTMKDNRINSLSILFWIFLSFFCKKRRKELENFWKQAKGIYYFLVLFVFIGIGIMFAYMQIVIIEAKEPPEKMKQFAAIIMGMVIFFILILCISVLMLKQKNQYVIKSNQMQEELFYYQKKYYEESLQKQEKLAGFRHEFCHHMKILYVMLERENYLDLKKYLNQLSDSYRETKVFHTGNYLADYILSNINGELSGQVEMKIIGSFPKQMEIKEIDFCVLFFNLMENVKEAVQKADGEKKIILEIRNYQKTLYLTVKNSIKQEKGKEINLETEKENKEMHGYGIKNIRQVVEKYQGEIVFKQEKDFFIVEVILVIDNN